MKERVGKFTLELSAAGGQVTISGPNHTAKFDRVSLASRIRFIKGLRKDRPEFAHFYKGSLDAHLRAQELLTAGSAK